MNSKDKHSTYNAGHVAVGLLGVTVAALIGISGPFIIVPAMRKKGGVPWMITPSPIVHYALKHVLQMRSSHQVGSNKIPRLIDLGSGDGRVCIQAAQQGFHSVGYEVK
jgi:hypothetical protein